MANTILRLLDIHASVEEINNYASHLSEYKVEELRSILNNPTLVANRDMMIYALKIKLVVLRLADIKVDYYLNNFKGHNVMGSFELKNDEPNDEPIKYLLNDEPINDELTYRQIPNKQKSKKNIPQTNNPQKIVLNSNYNK